MVTHVVLFKFKDPSPETLETASSKLLAMEGKVPSLRSIEVGADKVRSERSFDLGLITRFDSWEDLDAYRVDPTHAGVLAHMKEVVESSVVVDYES